MRDVVPADPISIRYVLARSLETIGVGATPTEQQTEQEHREPKTEMERVVGFVGR